MLDKRVQAGIETGKLLKERANKKYLEDPSICLSCSQAIPLDLRYPAHRSRAKKFCNKSCAAGFNNRLRRVEKPKKVMVDHRQSLLKPVEEAFCRDSKYSRANLKKRIIKDNLIDYSCFECGLKDQWNSKSLVLVLDHINGVNNDNRLENLRFLCPNCNSQTTTFSGRNINRNSGE